MSKKRNRQPDANPDVSEASTESCEEASIDLKCSHITKAINLNKVKKNLKKTGILSECPMCKKLEADQKKAEEICDISKPLWICLQCGEQNCSKEQKQHALEHYRKPHSDCHCMVTDSHYWSIWCYQCEIEVNPNSRKKLLETVEFIKKCVNVPQISQPKIPAIQCQKEMIVDVQEKEKHKMLNNLPKVGVSETYDSLLFESDADVEDNIEVENSHPEIGESGYSSEKASAVTSPVSPADHQHHHPNNDLNNAINSEDGSLDNNLDSTQVRHSVNINALTIPSPTDVSMTDLIQIRIPSEKTDRNIAIVSSENEASATTLSNSMIVNSDVTSPEVPTASLSSSAASKESPTSPVNDEEVAKRLDGVETWMATATSKCDKRNYNNGISNEDDPEEQDIYNEIGDIMTGISKLGIIGHQSPGRYVTKEGECSVESCLNQFTALELMTGSNKVVCEACTAREKKTQEGSSKMVCTSSTKQYLISQVPPILILHLKRFQTQRVGFRKVFKHVSFPMLLDLAPVCTNHKKSRLYSLYGVVEHSGTVHGGHYVAYVKTRLPLSPDDSRWKFLPKDKDPKVDNESNSSDSEGEEASAKAASVIEPPSGRWYYVSDSRVSEVDENTVLQSQAYLLFYERIL
ncbi:ubiquitin carboxyl-terminal hydrolase 45-like [Pogonomyrmex barbatus]|uniref:Ubiquitin carboxyl-terminal hydrolase 45-like n=1 Tax=Pogonomyrmex barbatus TaxID=144034 RepID=A0A6I9W425_9HYME|nr:ubiquitin carboxyl-terminal hydrolase 45-like [Pogonomyrmex barbatus]